MSVAWRCQVARRIGILRRCQEAQDRDADVRSVARRNRKLETDGAEVEVG